MSVNKSYKSTIIRKYGTEVELHRYLGDRSVRVVRERVLLGRNTRNNVNMFKLTNQKEGLFLPESTARSGDYVINGNHGEKYLIVGEHQEYDGNYKLSLVAGLMKCEYELDVKRLGATADERGNLKDTFENLYQNVPCYLEFISGNLRQLEPGLNADTEYKLYTTDLRIAENDRITVKSAKTIEHFSVLSLDYISFPGLLVTEIKRDRVRDDG